MKTSFHQCAFYPFGCWVRYCFVWVLVMGVATAAETLAPWTKKAVHDGVVYFSFSTPSRLERYDLATETWLSSVSLAASAQALHVDNSGIYYASGREVRRVALDGTGDAPIFNSTSDVVGLKGDGSYLFVFAPTYSEGRITSLRLSDNQFVDNWSSYYKFGGGYAIDPVGRKVYGITTQSSSFEVSGVAYSTTGEFGDSTSSDWGNGSYSASAAAFYVSPDYRLAVRNTGTVYSLPGLSTRGTLAGAVDDVAYYGNEIIVALRDDRLVVFSSSLLAAGAATLSKTALGITTYGDSVFAFSVDAEQTSGVAVEKLLFSDISAAEPGEALDPATAIFTPEDVIAAGDDSFFIVDQQLQSIFRWDATTFGYTQSLPLLDQPMATAYSGDMDRLYFGYRTGAVNQIKLDEAKTVEEPFANRPAQVNGLQAAGSLLFMNDASGAWSTFSTYDASGTLKDFREWAYYSREYVWSNETRRMYYFRDSQSPNDLLYSEIATDGTIGSSVDSPYHGTYSIVHPIRISDDGSGILIGSGNIFSASSLAIAGSLANAVTDAVSANNQWVTIRASGEDTQVQTWTTNNLFDKGITVPGEPYRLFELSDGRLLVLTVSSSRLVFSVVDLASPETVLSSPILREVTGGIGGYVGLPFTLTADAAGSGELTYQWYRNAKPIEGEDGPTFHIENPTITDVGIYGVVISNAYGSVASDTYEVVFEELPAAPTVTSQPSGAVLDVGNYFGGFYVNHTGTGPFTYQWRRNGAPISGAASNYYNPVVNNTVQASNYGSYDVVVTDKFGRSVTSDLAVLAEPARTLGYSLLARVPMSGLTVTMVLRGDTQPVLIRATSGNVATPYLADRLIDPVLSVYDSQGQLVAINDNWESAINATDVTRVSGSLGLGSMESGSKDASIFRSLPSGNYTFHVEGADGGTGWAMFEIYDAGAVSSSQRFPYIAALGKVAPDQPMVLGVVNTNAGYQQRLLRGWGAATGRDGAAADVAVVWQESSEVIYSNDDWTDSADASTIASFVSTGGLRSFGANSRDAAFWTSGTHTQATQIAELVAMNGSQGTALLELANTDEFSYYNRLPPLVLVGPEPMQVVAGNDVILSSRGTTGTGYYYYWSRNGIPIAGAWGESVLLRNIDASDEGNYAVTAVGPQSSFTSMSTGLRVVNDALDSSISATHTATSFIPGGTATISVEFGFPLDAGSLGWSVELPSGWSYVGGLNEPTVKPAVGTTGVLEWGWTDVPTTSPVTFSFDIRSPTGSNVVQSVQAFALVRVDGALVARLATPNPLLLRPGSGFHRGDTNFDGRISLTELLRVIEIYNTREGSVRTGRYTGSATANDGIQPGTGGAVVTVFHSADFNQDSKISLSELLRVIELYNYRSGTTRTGQYRAASGTNDGFAPGP